MAETWNSRKDNPNEGKKSLYDSNQMLTIVKQDPDGTLELLQQHNKEDLSRSQHPNSRNNSKRRSTIHIPQGQPLYCPTHRRSSLAPSSPISKLRR